VWTGKAGKKLSMHVCVAQAPVGSIGWRHTPCNAMVSQRRGLGRVFDGLPE